MKPLFIDKSPRKYRAFPLHQHEVWEITVNLAGSGTATMDGQDYPFTEGTIFCVAPGVAHRKVSPDGFVDGSIMLQDFVPLAGARVYQFEDDYHRSFQNLFALMFETLIKDGPNARALIEAIADAMYQLLVSWTAATPRSAAVELFQKTLLDNLANCEFDLTRAVRETGYSVSYFRKLFKQTTGQSPVSYFNRLRVEYARRQIQQYYGVRSLKEIAHSAGFEDPYYFSRIFSQLTGVSPQQFGKEKNLVKAQKISGDFLAG